MVLAARRRSAASTASTADSRSPTSPASDRSANLSIGDRGAVGPEAERNGSVGHLSGALAPPDAEQFSQPRLVGRHVALRPVEPGDYGLIREAELSAEAGVRWRWRGAIPAPEHWAQRLWDGILAQHVVVGRKHGESLGLVMAQRANFQDGHAYVGALRFGQRERVPGLILGFAMFIEYVFTCWPLRKLYLEAPEYNLDQFASGLDKYFELEGCLKDHIYYGGRYWDFLTVALYRDTWAEGGRKLLQAEWAPQQRVRVRVPPLTPRRSR